MFILTGFMYYQLALSLQSLIPGTGGKRRIREPNQKNSLNSWKLMPREVKGLAQGHTVHQWQSWSENSGFWILHSEDFYLYYLPFWIILSAVHSTEIPTAEYIICLSTLSEIFQGMGWSKTQKNAFIYICTSLTISIFSTFPCFNVK